MGNKINKKLFNSFILFLIFALAYVLPLELKNSIENNSILFSLIEKVSYWLFEEKNNYTIYFPSMFLILLPLGFLYALSYKIKTAKFAFINCAILVSMPLYVIFTKISIQESITASFLISAVFCCFFTCFIKNENKKYSWFFGIIFLLLSIATGGFNISFNFTLKPVVYLLSGSLPWIISLLLIKKSIFDKFLLLNIIAIVVIILCSITINIPIALVCPFLASISGSVWCNYIFQNENSRNQKSILFLMLAFLTSFAIGVIFPIIQNKSSFEVIKNVLGL